MDMVSWEHLDQGRDSLVREIVNHKQWVSKIGIKNVLEISRINKDRVSYFYIDSPRALFDTDFKSFLKDFEPYNKEDKEVPIISQPIGRKDDSNKPRYSLLPTGTINQVVQVLEYGASDKYEVDNWQKIPDARRRFYDAAMRHIDAWWSGEIIDIDKEGVKGSQLPHLAHAICCLLFLLWFDNKGDE